MKAFDRIVIGTDHAGYALKEHVKKYIAQTYDILPEDMGAHTLDPTDDYPDYIFPVAECVATAQERCLGIVIGGSGQGEAMAANRIEGIRATVYYGGPEDILTLGREHNSANMLSLGARFITQEQAEKAVDIFMTTLFPGDPRHIKRIDKLDR